jgi:uncharacterized damage-inducible protein DinB
MDTTFIRELYSYNQWSNQRTMAAASQLKNDTFTRNLGNSFSSVRDTLAHIMGAELIWLERWNGHSPEALLDATNFPTPDALAQRWAEIQQAQKAFLKAVTYERLHANLRYTNTRGQSFAYPLWQQMVHVVNHSSYHRGQITTLLRQLGAVPIPTDLLEYYDEKAE